MVLNIKDISPGVFIKEAVKHDSNNILLVSTKPMSKKLKHKYVYILYSFKLEIRGTVRNRKTFYETQAGKRIITHQHSNLLTFSVILLPNKLSESLEFVKGNKGEFNRRDTSRGI